MEIRIANAAPLGYAAFAIALWIAGMFQAGWFDATVYADGRLASTTILTTGGAVLGVAGILQCIRGALLDATLFIGFAAFWVASTRLGLLMPTPAPVPNGALLGWYDIVWTVFAACIWVAAARDGAARMLFAFGLALSLLAAALGRWTGIDALAVLAGYLGLITAVVGMYVAAAELINALHGHLILPVGDAGGRDGPRQR